jgi:hypothetical protein
MHVRWTIFCNFLDRSRKIHTSITADCRGCSRRHPEIGSPKQEIRSRAVNRPKSALAVLLLTIVAAAPAVADQASFTPQPPSDEFCSGCFAYLEFSPSLEPESNAIGDQALDTSTSVPAADEGNGRLKEQAAGVVAASKQ